MNQTLAHENSKNRTQDKSIVSDMHIGHVSNTTWLYDKVSMLHDANTRQQWGASQQG